MNEVIATERILATRANGERLTIELSVGVPRRVEGLENEEWACPVSLSPLYGRLHDAQGSTALQALCLALSLAIELLSKFKGDGGSLTNDDGTEYDLAPLSFGAAVRK